MDCAAWMALRSLPTPIPGELEEELFIFGGLLESFGPFLRTNRPGDPFPLKSGEEDCLAKARLLTEVADLLFPFVEFLLVPIRSLAPIGSNVVQKVNGQIATSTGPRDGAVAYKLNRVEAWPLLNSS